MSETPVALPVMAGVPDRLATRLLRRLEGRIRAGTITVSLPSGASLRLVGRTPGPLADVQLRRWRTLPRLIDGGTGLGEGYMAAEWDSSGLTELLSFLEANLVSRPESIRQLPWRRVLRLLDNQLFRKTRERTRRQIAHHYDLGNEFYRQWLDRSLTYSSAIFENAEQPLHAAQIHKFRLMAERADLRPTDRVLEIGCGWGGFAIWAAREIGCHVTAVTVSDAQFSLAASRIEQSNLGDKIKLLKSDCRDVQGEFDKIVSIEMFEALGERQWAGFFRHLRRNLAPGGRAALQVITIDDALFARYRNGVDFIQAHIFPGGMLPSPSALESFSRECGMRWLEARRFGSHYARTLRIWRQNFEAQWPGIEKLGFSDSFRRMWVYYLAYCEAGFKSGRLDLVQFTLARDEP
jgi:cyclopropane-fatty-acyl-phospholipid synthase